MKKKKILKIGLILTLIAILIGSGVAYYLFNMPHRNVHNADTDLKIDATTLVNEYLENGAKANAKYLSDNGESKILEVRGVIYKIDKNFNDQDVIELKSETDKAGVSCTMYSDYSVDISSLKIGDELIIKGVIRSGASFDEDMEIYQNVVLDKCSIVTK